MTIQNNIGKNNLQNQNSSSSVSKNALPQSPTNNLDVSAATYLGGAKDDFTNAVDISMDGNVVIVGGSLKNTNLGGKETSLLGGGDGTIVRYDAQTNQVISKTHLPGEILDLEVSKSGDIAVAYDGGIAVLNADATKVKWSKSLTNVSRVAISDTGKVGAVRNLNGSDKAYLFDSKGEQLKEWSTNSGKRQFLDIAVTDQNGGMVIATGFEQKTRILQVAFTRAWSYEGDNLWKNYDFDDKDIYKENLMADTRGQRVAIGRDGELYSSYYVNGGTGFSIFYRDPFDLSDKVTSDRKIETDLYNTPTNVNSIKMTWYGRYDLETGELVKGQSILGRLDNGKGNSVDVDSITATEDGTIIIAGSAAARIANRDEQTIEGQKVSPYTSYDGFIATISSDFQERLSWTPVSKSSGVVASSRNGTTAAVSTTNFTGSQITHNAIQDSKGGQKDGYLLVIGGNDTDNQVEPVTPQSGILDINSLESYGGNQDNPKNGTVEIFSDNEVKLSGNRWQKLEIKSTITSESILRFEFAGNGKSEIQGIGFDNDSVVDTKVDAKTFFQVDGSQKWGIQNLGEFIIGQSGDKDIYEIPVGQFFIGNFDFLTIANDDDQKNPDAESTFKNIQIIDSTSTDSLNISINGNTENKEIQSYGGESQNTSLTSTVRNNDELQLEKNGWVKLDINGYQITKNTVLSFEFTGNGAAEIQGIGFDNDNVITRRNDGQHFFQIDGSQSWGMEELDKYIVGSDSGFTKYSINVGDIFTGQFDFLTIANDDDSANPTALGQFQNIELVG